MSALEKAVRGDVDLSIAYLDSGGKEEEFTYEGVRYYSINPYKSKCYLIFRLKRLFMGLGGRDMRILRRLEKVVTKVYPDLIHIHGTENCFGMLCGEDGTVSVDGRKIPVAVSMQGLLGVYFGKYFSGVPREAVKKYEGVGQKLRKRSAMRGWRRMRHQAEIERIMLGHIRYVFGRTDFDRNETSAINPEGKYFVVGEIMREPFYRDVARLAEKAETQREGKPIYEAAKPRDGKFRIVSTVSGGLYKGYELLLRTARELKNADVDFEWTVVGYSEKEPLAVMCEKYTGLHASELGVSLVGRKNAGELVEILDGADVYCHVSHIENSPNSVCEAMLRSLPVVAAAVGGVPSIVEDGVTGILYPDSDAKACAEALMSLRSEPERAAAMGVAGRRVAAERHEPEEVRSQLLGAYADILRSVAAAD